MDDPSDRPLPSSPEPGRVLDQDRDEARVTKQVAQQRFVTEDSAGLPDLDPGDGFSRFIEPARSAVMAAQEEAWTGNDQIRFEHLALGCRAAERAGRGRSASCSP